MTFVQIGPPGTWCLNGALFQMLRGIRNSRFLEVGCGAGAFSLTLLEQGFSGVELDFSSIALKQASMKLKRYIDEGKYKLVQGKVFDNPVLDKNFDIVISLFVMEHVENDIEFLKYLKSKTCPGGNIFIAVPGREDKWCIDDDTAGYLRRYDREDIFEKLREAGFINPIVWSIAVRVANILSGMSNLIIKHSEESEKLNLSLANKTKTSGVREIPFKTVFPSFFKIFFNRISLWPFFVTQRLFYNTSLGLTMLVKAQCP